MDDRETGNELSGLAAALVFIGLGVFLFIISMLFSSGAFGENTMLYKVQDAIASVIGGGLIFTGDVTLALSIMLIFQGFSLFTHKGISVILYSLWLFVPFFLVVSALHPSEGLIPAAIGSLLGKLPAIPVIISLLITIAIRAVMTLRPAPKRDLDSGRKMIGRDKQYLLEAPDMKEEYDRAEAECARLNNEIAIRERTIAELSESIEKLSKVKPVETETEKENLELKERAEKLEHELKVQGIIRSADTPSAPEYQALAKKHKELLALTPAELKKETKKLKGYQQYAKQSGAVGSVKSLVDEMEAYTFAPVSFIVKNGKGSKKVISSDKLVIPPFSEDQAMRIARAETEGYAKSGYRFSSFEENLEITGTKLPITYFDFIVPWCKDISYDDEENAESLFLWDFHFKYAPDRSLSPYTGPRQKRQD